MEARAQAKMIRVSPQKARLVVDLVRGKQVKEALGMLEYVNKSATPAIIKVVKSAAQNAVYNEGAETLSVVLPVFHFLRYVFLPVATCQWRSTACLIMA